MHDHISHYFLRVGSKAYQQNTCFGVSPEIVLLPSPFGLVDCLTLLLQVNIFL